MASESSARSEDDDVSASDTMMIGISVIAAVIAAAMHAWLMALPWIWPGEKSLAPAYAAAGSFWAVPVMLLISVAAGALVAGRRPYVWWWIGPGALGLLVIIGGMAAS